MPITTPLQKINQVKFFGGDEVTVKRFQRTSDGIELLPENPDFRPIVVTPDDDFEVEGLAVGLIRNQPLN